MYVLNMTQFNFLFLHAFNMPHTDTLPFTFNTLIHYQPLYWDKFEEYQSIYNRKYQSNHELERRYKIFLENYEKLNTYAKFMDLSPEEFKNETDSCCLFQKDRGHHGFYRTQYSCTLFESIYPATIAESIPPQSPPPNPLPPSPQSPLPPPPPPFPEIPYTYRRHRTSPPRLPYSLDWRDHEVVTPVKNQGQCGSCWTFSATGAMEAAWALKTGNLVSLSEQQLIDCVKQDQGCNGGQMDDAFEYAMHTPICPDTEEPYEARDDTCQKCPSKIRFSACRDIPPNNQLALKEAVALYGPVSVSIEADQSYFRLYTGGIITDTRCGTNLDHGVLIVGYGEDPTTSQKYWLVKNSWGPDWGENGYVRIARSDSENDPGVCGIAMQASYPVV